MKTVVIASALLGVTGLASAGTITVTHGDVVADGTTCTLAQAIDAANRANNPGSGVNGPYGDPPPGSTTTDPLQHSVTREIGSGSCTGATGSFANPESNTIVFAQGLAGTTLPFATADNFWYGPNALPPIASSIVIDGGEAGITLANTHPTRLRFFFVGADATATPTTGYNTPGAGALTLRHMHLTGGRQVGGNGSVRGGGGAGLGGAIFSQGELVLERSTLSDNRAIGGNGGLSANGGGGIGGGLGGSNIGGLVPRGAGSPGFDGNTINGGNGGNGGGRGGNGDSQSSGSSTTGGGGGGAGFGGGDGGIGGIGSRGNGADGGGFGSVGGSTLGASLAGGGGGGIGSGGGGGGGLTLGATVTRGGGGGGGGFGGGGGGGGSSDSHDGGSGGAGGFGGGGGGGGLRAGGTSSSGGAGGFGAGSGNGAGVTPADPSGGGGGAGFGGAIFNFAGQVTLDQVTLSDNIAQGGVRGHPNAGDGRGFGGAVFNLDGAVVLNHVTAAGNTAEQGVVLYNRNQSATASLVMQRSLVADSTGSGDIVAQAPVISDSLVEDPVGILPLPLDGDNGNRIGVDPLLGVLGANGGATPTRVPGDGSVAIDAAPCATPPGSDQRGIARPLGLQCDFGAVEVVPPGTITVAVSGEGTVSAAAAPVPESGGIVACADGGDTCQAVYAVGETVTLEATPAVGHRLVAWGGDCAAAGSALQVDIGIVEALRACTADFARNPPGEVGFGILPSLDVDEGTAGSTTVTIPLTLSDVTADTVTVDYTVTPAPGSAGQTDSDFASGTSGSIDILPGAVDAQLVFAIATDTTVEPDEAFELSFAVSSTLPPPDDLQPNATLTPQAADGLVLLVQDDDGAELALPDVSQAEATGTMSFALTLSAPVQGGIAIGYYTLDDSATAGDDYTETDGILLLDGSTTTVNMIEVPILDDDLYENDEHFDLRLDAACAFTPCALLRADGRGTIANDDAPEPGSEIFGDGFEDD